jgi:urease gamma subunit
MNELQVQKWYFAVVAETRKEKRNEALDNLKKIKSEKVQNIARNGKIIMEILYSGRSPKDIEKVLSDFEHLPMMDYWYDFVETSGQVLLAKALSEISKDRKLLLFYGMKLMKMKKSAGFQLTETSIEMVKITREYEKNMAWIANDILKG